MSNQLKFDVNMDQLRKNKLFVAVPMYGGLCYGSHAHSLMTLASICTQYGIQMQTKFLYNESLVQRARNYLADAFLRSDCQQMIFIDSDIDFKAQDVLILADLQNKNPDYDVIAGAYPKKCISWEKIKSVVDKGMADEDPNILENFVGDYVFNAVENGAIRLDTPAEIAEAGTGFMMIRRESFEKFMQFFPRQSYKPDHVRSAEYDGSREIYAFFDCIVDRGPTEQLYHELIEKSISGDMQGAQELGLKIHEMEKNSSKRYLSEDYYFCQKLRQAGMHIYLAPWVELGHNGFYRYGGSLSALAHAGQNVTVDVDKIKKK